MKFYLAASYLRREQMAEYARQLRERGHEVTSRWLTGAHQAASGVLGSYEPNAEADRFANEDLDDITEADVLVLFTEAPQAGYLTGARLVEYGYALGLHDRGHRIELAVIGPRENVFHFLTGPVSYFLTWNDFLRARAPAVTREGVGIA